MRFGVLDLRFRSLSTFQPRARPETPKPSSKPWTLNLNFNATTLEGHTLLGGPFDLVSRVSKVGYGGL